jgi:hypothetical protein
MSRQPFKPADINMDNTPKKVKNMSKLEAFIVNFNDGEGKDQTRIVFKVPGEATTFILQERIQGANVAVPSHDWFAKMFHSAIEALSGKKAAKSV